ncbi:acetate--CoA ligase [Desulfuribacillus stibiiarsenatis]|uniref:acetate--CoA ligase n=1 Tax=Desulfuribacillus stibiiarsenatis TaxID=1390249 RepID=A0A1E5L209_9FIRM|nr:acetate--CoA ligase [Desulfuribacillus stibiiarsenatis]OEH84188.1 acetate--CoA ligase [Desulfuribacillus stibiiarsenatis]
MKKSTEVITRTIEDANMQQYDEAVSNFQWETVEKGFSWYGQEKCNIVYEAIDRKCEEGHAGEIALYFCDGTRDEQYTYEKLQKLSCRFARGLQNLNVEKGDRVFIFLPRTPEYYVALLGAIRIGAIGGPLFEAFMEKAVKDRLEDSDAKVVVTTKELLSRIPLHELPELKHVILVGADEADPGKRQVTYQEIMRQDDSPFVELVSKDDGMMIHYTSGSTGKPKGVLLSHYAMVHMYLSGKYAYDLRPDDIYWCVADPGWITGTSAGMWAPWLNSTPVVMRGGRFNPEEWYATIQKYKVTVWFSAPTAFRMLMASGAEISKSYDLSSLRHILSAGEPLNPEIIKWGVDTFDIPIYDNWWMTETGSTIVANFPALPIKLGSMGKPLPGIHVDIVDHIGQPMEPNELGNLAIKPKWPGMMRMIWNNPKKYNDYFLNGWYISGDSAYKDEDGYFWFEGRIDDVINTMGERVGPFEVESKLVEHPAVAEAGVIGVPDPIRGEVVKAYITLRQGFKESDELKEDIMNFIREKLAAHARPRIIEVRDKLPKTRSGKIMRRVLKARELNMPTGDVSTIDD